MRWKRRCDGFFNLTGALYAVTIFFYSDGRFRLEAQRKFVW